jgi:hypothetical protein
MGNTDQVQKSEKIKKFIIGGTYGAVDEAISMIPGVNIVWAFVKSGKEALDSVALVRTEELLGFFENNSEELLNEHLLQNEQFITGLGLTYEKFLRQRIKLKRDLIKRAFLDFAKAENKEGFELERVYGVLETLSIGSIKFLGLLNTRAIPPQQEVMERSPYKNSDEFWAGMPRLQKEHPVSRFLQNHIDMNSSIGGSSLNTSEQEILKFKDDYVTELIGHGILRYIVEDSLKTTTRFGKTELKFNMEFSFTSFGLSFINYIMKDDN